MFRALNHEGVAAECFYALIVGDRKLSGETKRKAFTACAVLAKTMTRMRG